MKDITNSIIYLRLPEFFYSIGISSSQKAYEKQCKDLGIVDFSTCKLLSNDTCAGTTNFLSCKNGGDDDIAIVGVRDDLLRKNGRARLASVLSHEAVHCIEDMLKTIGEKYCGEEIYAYLEGYIVAFFTREVEKVLK